MSPRRLGVLGTFVWDRIVPVGSEDPNVEAWGGISYSLAALSTALPDGWSVRPLVNVGADVEARARDFLETLPRLDLSAVRVVAEPNNRVELRYRTEAERVEILSGGVPGWDWSELEPALRGCDALYVNLISGWEVTLETAQALSGSFAGPTYADFHSLLLGSGEAGARVPRVLSRSADWLRCFDAVQMNETELSLLRRGPTPEPSSLVAERPVLVAVTRSTAGVTCVLDAAQGADPFAWGDRRAAANVPMVRRCDVAAEVRSGDPTGCGDVWGATFFARLLAGDGLRAAMEKACRLAALNVEATGAGGLVGRLDVERIATERRAAGDAAWT